MKLFASLYIGSYETILKILQTSNGKNLKEIDCQRYPIEIIKDVYTEGNISKDTWAKLIEVLTNMSQTIREYQIDDYVCYGGPTFGRAGNVLFCMDQIQQKTKLKIQLLSNSEQRFLSYMAVACSEGFDDIVAENAAIVDIGGASLQITLFINGKVKTTQHLSLGTATMRDNLRRLSYLSNGKEQAVQIMNKELGGFANMYLPEDSKISTLIILGDNLTTHIKTKSNNTEGKLIKASKYLEILDSISSEKIDKYNEMSDFLSDHSEMLEPALMFHKALVVQLGAKNIYTPNVSINEGIAYQHFISNKMINVSHDFEQDVITASWSLAKRYGSYHPHLKALDNISTKIFDAMKKYHGLSKRDRLLIRCVAILHDCGKYISLAQAPDCSYSIIINSEILGLSHKEREMVATAVMFIKKDIVPYEELANHFTKEEYVKIVKMLAILRVANALDRSHKQKFKDITMTVRKRELLITLETVDSFALEKGMFEKKADFFEDVFDIRPVLKDQLVLG